MQLIPIKKFIINTCFIQFLWFFRLKWWSMEIGMIRFLIGIIGHCTDQRNLLYQSVFSPFFQNCFLCLHCTNAQMKSQIRHSPFFHVGRVFCRHLFWIGLLISKLKWIIFAWSRHLFVGLLYSCASFVDSSAFFKSITITIQQIAVMNIKFSLQSRDSICR